MRTILFFILLLTSVFAQKLTLSPVQINDLGVTLERPAPRSQITLGRFAAQTKIPLQNRHVANTLAEGVVQKIYAAPDQSVRKGDKICLISSPTLMSLQNELINTDIEAAYLAEQLERTAMLNKEGFAPYESLLQTRADLARMEAKKTTLIAKLGLLGLDEKSLKQIMQSRKPGATLSVRAPVSGKIAQLLVAPGAHVGAGEALFEIVKSDALWIEVQSDIETADALKEGDTISVDNRNALLIAKSARVNAGNQTLMLRFFVSPAGGLYAGERLSVTLTKAAADAWELPKNAVVRYESGAVVFRRSAQGFDVVKVEILNESSNRIVVASTALSAEDRIAVSSLSALKGALEGLGGEGDE
jgi:multidrug efflux pump subunit AcrA (membrane-fusion protein)